MARFEPAYERSSCLPSFFGSAIRHALLRALDEDSSRFSSEELKVTWFLAGSAHLIDCSKRGFDLNRELFSMRRMLGDHNSVCDSTRRF